VSEVAMVASSRREMFRLATVARFEADPLAPDRKVTGRMRHFGLPPALDRRLFLHGEETPPEFTAAAASPEREAN
jgi:pilus assembly protein CpaF